MLPRISAAVLCAVAAFAQTAATSQAEDPSRAPTPVPELQKLARSVGTWKTSQSYRSSPEAPVFKSQSTEKVRWSEGKQFLISEQRGLTSLGWESRVLVTSWNRVDQHYRVIEVQQGGFTEEMTLSFEGDVQKVLGYRRFGDLRVRTELTVEHTSADEYRFRMECTGSSGVWVCSEGVAKRVR